MPIQKKFNFLKNKKPYKRKHNTRYININYYYTMQDIVSMFNVNKRTVYAWFSCGLKVYSNKKPYMVFGVDLKQFLENRNIKYKINTKPYELACFRCKKATIPSNNEISIILYNKKIIHIKAYCNICNCKVNKAQNINTMERWLSYYKAINMQQIKEALALYTNNNSSTGDTK
jgi:hypothetical protein